MARVGKFVSSLGRVFGIAGIVILVAMMLVTGVDVCLRYTFNSPILGSSEIIELMMLTVAFTTIADNLSVKEDLVPGQIQPAFIRGHVSDVTHPHLVRRIHLKLLLQQILRFASQPQLFPDTPDAAYSYPDAVLRQVAL